MQKGHANIKFLADFHYLQDRANCGQTDLFWHEKHHFGRFAFCSPEMTLYAKKLSFLLETFCLAKFDQSVIELLYLVTAASLEQAIEALNGADVNLFCRDTGSKQGQPVFFLFFYLFLYLFQKPKHLFKENMQSKLLKVIV